MYLCLWSTAEQYLEKEMKYGGSAVCMWPLCLWLQPLATGLRGVSPRPYSRALAGQDRAVSRAVGRGLGRGYPEK